MRSYLYISCLLLLLWPKTASAQFVGQQNLTHYSIKEGLSQVNVRSITQDETGLLWIGTGYGLNRFDGHHFKIFNENRRSENALSSGWINALLPMPDGTLYIGTNEGLNFFDPELHSFVPLKKEAEDILEDVRIISLANNDDGTILIGTFKGIYIFDPFERVFLRIPQPEAVKNTFVHHIITTDLGRIWLASDAGLYELDATTSEVRTLFSIEHHPALNVRTLAWDGTTLWMGTRYEGVYHWNPDEQAPPKPVNGTKTLPQKHITQLVHHNNALWIGTRAGMWKYTPEHDRSEEIHSDSFGGKMIFSLFVDFSENLWIGTQNDGIWKLDLKPTRFTHIASPRLFREHEAQGEVWALLRTSTHFWVGTNVGLLRFDHQTGKREHFTTANSPLPSNLITQIQHIGDDMWICTFGGGLVRFSPQQRSWTVYTEEKHGLPSNQVNMVWIGENGNRLIATNRGLAYASSSTSSFVNISTPDGKPLPFSWTIARKPNTSTFLIGTRNGLFHWELGAKSAEKVPFTVEQDQSDKAFDINAIHWAPSDNLVWLGTTDGVIKLALNTTLGSLISLENGLPSSLTHGLLPTDDGLWVATNRGIAFMDHDGIIRQTYGLTTHMQMNEPVIGASHRGNDGYYYLGGSKGITRFQPSSVTNNPYAPKVRLRWISASRNDSTISDVLQQGKTIRLDYGFRLFQIGFDVMEFTNPLANTFAYRLLGYNDDWVEKHGQPMASFTNIAPGSYRFELKASNNEGVWAEQLTYFDLIVSPPFWEQFWVRFLLLSLLFATGLGLFLSREFRQRRIQKKLEEKVQERTQELEESTELIQRSEQMFRSIAENAADLIMLSEPNGLILYVSPSAETLLGYELNQVVHSNIMNYIHPDDHGIIHEQTLRIFKEGRTHFGRYRIRHADGSWRFFESSGSSVRNEDGRTETILTVSHDITDELELENRLLEAKEAAEAANRAKSNFLASISHELRTPLNAILGYSRLLFQDQQLQRKQKEYAETMYKSGEHLLNMINDVLDISKIEAGRMQVDERSFSLRATLNDLEAMFRLECAKKHIQFHLHYTKEIPELLFGDVNKIRQVLINLLSNAVKFTDTGSVTLNVGYEPRTAKRGLVQFCISDTGRGIPNEQLPLIFEPFRQVSGFYSEGTGLGLAITQKLVHLMGGEISLKSEWTKGTSAEVYLPIRTTELLDADTEHNPISIISGSSPKVLIIDDIHTNANVIAEILSPVGFTCNMAYDGISGLKLIAEFQPNVVLLDLRMPGMSGENVLQVLRQHPQFHTIPVIAVTASGLVYTKEELLKIGFNDVIFKPVVQEQLFSSLARALSLEYEYSASPELRNGSAETSMLMETALSQVAICEALEGIDNALLSELVEVFELLDLERALHLVPKLPVEERIKNALHTLINDRNFSVLLSIAERFEK